MFAFTSLPRTLLALTLLMGPPMLSVTASQPASSTNDPFRAIVLVHRAQQPQHPLCCLKLPPSTGLPEGPEDVLISFEEWKSKQFQAQSHSPIRPRTESFQNDSASKSSRPHSETPAVDAHALPPDPLYPKDTLPPHFRVPITDRFNYANMDCSARVHMSHKSSRSSSSVLSSKKDKYMLSPCTTKHGEEQFVVVELCDDIRIDTVQLANFEFFSGVFKDFSVSVAKTYTGTNEGWTPAGTYRAKNVRGVQSFHLPTSLRDFYRYIRIDFHSHYGHEYYCPVSLLRVYGLTHLEEWKWDMWESESRARLKDAGVQQQLITEGLLVSEAASSTSVSTGDISAFLDKLNTPPIHPSAATSSLLNLTSTTSRKTASSSLSTSAIGRVPIPDAGDEEQHITTIAATIAPSSVLDAMSSFASAMPSPPSSASPTLSTGNHSRSHYQNSEVHAVTALSTPPTHPSTLSHPQQPSVHATVSPLHGSGESVYRTIMNRLTVLEASHTLYARYVEEQTAGVREVLRKLGEEVGRLETIGQMQAQMYQRTVHDWERQRLRLELEHGELLSRVNYLSDEIVLEKRLGIAQLCLLLAVLVFMGFTRGAPSVQQPHAALNRSVREWGVRNLSFGSSRESGWNPLRLRNRGPAERSGSTRAEKAISTDTRVVFPIQARVLDSNVDPHVPTHSPRHPLNPFKSPTGSTSSLSFLSKRSHAPSSFRTPTKARPLISMDPPRAQPIARSNSSTISAHPSARSAKRWARTAHLHEVNVVRERRGSGGAKHANKDKGRENEGPHADVFSLSSSAMTWKSQDPIVTSPVVRRPCRPFSPLGAVRCAPEDCVDADAWIDTDVEGSDSVSECVTLEGAVVRTSPDVFGVE
ncbi:hypothetical protein PAXRUDRAFT_831944 [Paxillus rubicundulus Ve08.2h10]|uniref:SUN domain-containing protein n=1 Tax=Paxillus rubicundulus Ve08.2h10 TaxID=930991 RepID=A0A0D0CS31_9AGAM|nr:hypothetical protein PAXRUDRAFT_831944 [Paxillus rubicundulus Ve08.2h10]